MTYIICACMISSVEPLLTHQIVCMYVCIYVSFVVQYKPKARVAYLIKHGRECCKWLVKLSNFMDLLTK